MDATRRQITKIAREVSKFTVRMLKTDGVGVAEYDFIHAVRKNPGITQAALRELLTLDKGAAARRAENLEAKGYLVRRPNPADGRSRLLYATHGHVYNTAHLPPLQPGDILLHGHTHIPAWEVFGTDNLYLNPGSVSIPKAGTPHSYMTLENGVFTWKELGGEAYHTLTL